MCVLTYLPLYEEGFIFTHSRDESIGRPKAIAPRQYSVHQQLVIYPKDAKAGGTWMATSSEFTLCLLNGAFQKHTSQPPYRQSRGMVIPDFFRYNSVFDFVRSYDFSGIEPFTLVVVDTLGKYEMTEMRWDAHDLTVTVKDNRVPHIWSSVTLYPPAICQERERWFGNWLALHPTYNSEDILQFHLHGGNGDRNNDMRMNRNGELLTQCIMQVQRGSNHRYTVTYQDLLAEEERKYCVF
ncbi:MAG: NRDE family protein [Spirosomataceae bacterium]